MCYNNNNRSETLCCLSKVIMSNIKRFMSSYEDDKGEVPTLEELLEWLDFNGELFHHLPTPEPCEVIGYED
jgi:hypothetical protein